MKWLWITLAIIAVLIIIGIIVAPRLMFRFCFHTPSRSKKIPSYYVDTPHYKVSRAGMAKMESYDVEDHYITSRDGLKLHGYLWPAEEKPKKFVLFIHGYRSYARPEAGPFIEYYRENGYSMLAPDDRAHRPSEGDWIGFGVLDRLDCVDWAKYLVETYGEDIEILLHGVSMGSATVMAASGEPDLPEQVKGITADCGYTSAWDILRYQTKQMHLPEWMLRKCEKISEKKAGYNYHEHTPIEQIKRARVPIFFAHGEKDTMVPVEMVYELYEACPTEKRLLVSPEAAHGETIAFMPEEYHRNMEELFGIGKDR